jgi:ribosomal protein S12 methylthiotransferase
MLGLLKNAGYRVVNDPCEADAIVVNTCGFIGPAKEESIETILEYSKYKKTKNCKVLIVTGCLAQRYSDELIEEIPEIDVLLGTGNYTDIISSIDEAFNGKKICLTDGLDRPLTALPRQLSTIDGTAYLKISDGCDNRCSYCIIPSLRGKARSRSFESLIEETAALVKGGVREIILIGQDVTRYGYDLDKDKDLIYLLNNMIEIEDLKWIRLLYLNPERVTDTLLDFIALQPKICKYLDIPIQHISDKILKRMNRSSTSENIKALLAKARKKIPGIVIRTSLIVGFPGEGEGEFNDLALFLREFQLNHVGVFSYSPEEGTDAATFSDQIDDAIKEERRASLMSTQKSISKRLNKMRLNEICEVLIEGKSADNTYIARSYGEAPEVDGQIYVLSDKSLEKGEFVNVKITKTYEYDLLAEIYESGE